MAGYTPVFGSIYTGTLYGRWPAAAVWATLLPLFNRHGELDMSIEALCGMTGWPRNLLEKGIAQLMEPDARSRTEGSEGRRLAPIDPNRSWGWKAVNHGKYAEKARKMARQAEETASGRDAARKAAARAAREDVQPCPAMSGESGDVPLSDSSLQTPVSNRRERAASAAPPPAKPSSRGTRIPEDWEPTASGIELPSDLNLEGEGAKFRDYWRARPGQGGVKLDWSATWRNWLRRSIEEGKYARRSGPGKPLFGGGIR